MPDLDALHRDYLVARTYQEKDAIWRRILDTDKGMRPSPAVYRKRAAQPPPLDEQRLARALNATVGTVGWLRITPRSSSWRPDSVNEWLENAAAIARAYREDSDD